MKRKEKKAATDILNGFIYFEKWCYMNKDSETAQNTECWKQEAMPSRIVPDSWSTNIIPIRKIIQKKEEIFEMKSNSKTNSVRSAQSNRSKLSRHSLRSKLKKNPIDLELKKPLRNIMDENIEEEEDLGKVEIIQLNNTQNINVSNSKPNRKKRLSKLNTKNRNKSNKQKNALSINLNTQNTGNKYNRQSMNIGLKTTRLSMKSSNAYKYHPNKPFTFDHTGQKMSVLQIKPEKIPNNSVTPLISFTDNLRTAVDIEKENTKSKQKSAGRGISTARKKKRKKKTNSKISYPKLITKSVPVQPPIESIIKMEGGVSLKTKNTTLKGKGRKKNKIENMSRSEYNQYIGTLKHLTKTHVFDTFNKGNNNESKASLNRIEGIDNESSIANDENLKPMTPTINTLRNGSPKSHKSPISVRKQRMKRINKSPNTIKYKRALMARPKTDRLISPYNNSLLPKINNTLPLRSATDLTNKFENRTQKYQRRFRVNSPKSSKIQKEELGKLLFGSK